jgi:hypothetical protein
MRNTWIRASGPAGGGSGEIPSLEDAAEPPRLPAGASAAGAGGGAAGAARGGAAAAAASAGAGGGGEWRGGTCRGGVVASPAACPSTACVRSCVVITWRARARACHMRVWLRVYAWVWHAGGVREEDIPDISDMELVEAEDEVRVVRLSYGSTVRHYAERFCSVCTSLRACSGFAASRRDTERGADGLTWQTRSRRT